MRARVGALCNILAFFYCLPYNKYKEDDTGPQAYKEAGQQNDACNLIGRRLNTFLFNKKIARRTTGAKDLFSLQILIDQKFKKSLLI